MDESKKITVPRVLNEPVVITGGASGKEVTITRVSEDELRWFYNELPQDVRTLIKDKDSYLVGQSTIGFSVQGGWIDWDFFVENL